MTLGQIVVVKRGRDKGLLMVILAAEGKNVFLADGKKRTIRRAKKKNIKHLQLTNMHVSLKPVCGRDLNDADIRKQLSNFEGR